MTNVKDRRFWFAVASILVISLFAAACETDEIGDDGNDNPHDTATETAFDTDTGTAEEEQAYGGSCLFDELWQCTEYYGKNWDAASVIERCDSMGQTGLITFYTKDPCPTNATEAYCDRYNPDDPESSFKIWYYDPQTADESKCTANGGTYVTL